MLVNKGKYVRIRAHILMPGDRDLNIPKDTSLVPLKMWVKGRLNDEAELFEEVLITTASGRVVKGILKEVDPKPKHSYGDFVDEVMSMRELILKELWGNNDEL